MVGRPELAPDADAHLAGQRAALRARSRATPDPMKPDLHGLLRRPLSLGHARPPNLPASRVRERLTRARIRAWGLGPLCFATFANLRLNDFNDLTTLPSPPSPEPSPNKINDLAFDLRHFRHLRQPSPRTFANLRRETVSRCFHLHFVRFEPSPDLRLHPSRPTSRKALKWRFALTVCISRMPFATHAAASSFASFTVHPVRRFTSFQACRSPLCGLIA